jgi:small redox-active disulfide protein 2
MEIKILGTGCAKCQKLYDAAAQAVQQSGVTADLSKVEKIDEIASYGIAFTPGLVIDGTVKSSGKVPKVGQIVAWIQEAAGRAG